MKATVKPRKQLEYELKRDGYVYVGNGYKDENEMFFNNRMFDLCLEEIEIKEIYFLFCGFYSKHSDLDSDWDWNWKKEWFIPNSFRGE